MTPTQEVVGVGLAGEDPADIARYLMARGARDARIAPNGEAVAYLSSQTGIAQLWISEIEGGQPRQLTFGHG